MGSDSQRFSHPYILVLTLLSFIPLDFLYAQEWQVMTIDRGVKPSLEIGSDGLPQVSYILETAGGFVKHAVWDPVTATFDTSTADVGYFFGPPDLALDVSNAPHIVYHNHQLADQVHSFFSSFAGIWLTEQVASSGHDGWDNSIFIDQNGYIHTSTIDPAVFSGIGVEYSYFDGAQWTVEPIGFSFLMYGNATSIGLDSQFRPHITYYNDSVMDLMYAVKDAGLWSTVPIESDGDVGRFSSLRIDDNDVEHISYYQHLASDTGVVKYAVKKSTEWSILIVDTLYDVDLSFARNMTSLVLDTMGQPHIAYCDQSVLKYAHFAGSSWMVDTVVTVSDSVLALGQLASLQLDSTGSPHVAYYELTSMSPLDGTIRYARRGSITGVDSPESLPEEFALLQNYPNPFNPKTTIVYQVGSRLSDRAGVSAGQSVVLSIYNVLGQEVATLVNEVKEPGIYSVTWNATGFASGMYFYKLRAGSHVATRKLVLVR